jgi:DNA-binding SARP family transcriptional activator/TolB-like protein
VRLLGPLLVTRHDAPVELPPSRKARALLAYLCMAPGAVTRMNLCELLWEGADDPRAELRWCLSRLRAALGDEARIVAVDDGLRLEPANGNADTEDIDRALATTGPAGLDLERCRSLASLFRGDFLQGLEIEDSASFSAWLTGQRHRYRAARADLLARIAAESADEQALPWLEQWRALSPYDPRVHRALLAVLVRRGRVREAEEHLDGAVKMFEDEGLDAAPLHAAWRAARAQAAPPTEAIAAVPAPPLGEPDTARPPRRASIAVMPFLDAAIAAAPGTTGDALAHDVIVRLAKLRALFVIAPGTVFELKARGHTTADAGRLLDVDYVVGGAVRRVAGELRVDVELIDARAGRVVWTETLAQREHDALAVLDEIGHRLVAAIAGEVEALERNRAVLKAPSSLDAWEAHHRGLWHMYRFNQPDNALARHYFEMAVRLDPTFSRAYAGLSFTHFQDAFQGWSERGTAVDRAFDAAGQGMLADERDPSVHWAMGRALWLRNRHEQCVAELEQAIELSPNFAMGHYTLAFVHSQAGDPAAAVHAADVSRRLSPYDPLLFGMLGARTMALVRLGRYDEAAVAGLQAAARPNAHVHIHAIAAFTLALAGSMDDARSAAAGIRKSHPGYTVADFFRAFRLDARGVEAFRRGAKRLGMG